VALDDPQPVTGTDFIALRAWVKDSLSKHSEFYKEAPECYDFVAGHPWTDEDKDALKASGQPAVSFNLVGPTIDAICGMEVNNRQEVKFLPRTMGDAAVNEKLTSLAEWARDECQAEDEESFAFRDTAICGRGVTETRLDFEEEPTGKIIVDRRDPMECFVDPAASKANFADAKYMGDFRDLDTADAQAMFPGIMPSALNAYWAVTTDLHDGGEGYKRDYPEETRAGLRDDKRPKTVRVVRIQWWERVRAYMVVAPQGIEAQQPEPKQISAEEWEPNAEAMQAEGYQAAPIFTRAYKQAFLGANSILPTNEAGEGEEPTTIDDIDGFSLCWITGRWDRNKRYHYGIVRPLMDPQRIVNKSLIQTLQILKTNAKGGLMIEKGAFANPREAEQDWSDPSKTIVVSDGALSGGRIQPRVAPPLPAALGSLLEFSMTSIRNVTGVNLELLGAADREQAASLEYQRRQSAMSILAPLFDALRRYRKTEGYVLISCLRRLPPGVLVRVVQDEDQQAGMPPQPGQQPQQPGAAPKNAFAPFDPAAFGLDKQEDRFDVIVDEAPSSPNQKEQTWAALQPFIAGLAEKPAALAVALKYSPLPLGAAQELSQAMTGSGIPPEVQQQIQEGQQQIAQLTQENETLKADRSVDAEKLKIEGFKAETERADKLRPEQGGDGGASELELLKLQIEQQDAERQRQFEASENRQKEQFDLLMQHLKNAGQIAASRVRADAAADSGIETGSEVGV